MGLEEVKFRRKDVKAKEKRLHLRIANLHQRGKSIPYYKTRPPKKDDDDSDEIWDIASISDESHHSDSDEKDNMLEVKMNIFDDENSLKFSSMTDRTKSSSKETTDTQDTRDTYLSIPSIGSQYTIATIDGIQIKVMTFEKWQEYR